MSQGVLWGCLSVLAGLIAMVPTSIMLSKGTKLEQIPLNLTGKITTYLVCDLSWPRRAILGNAAAIIILMIGISNSGETLIKKKITLIIIALIGLVWSSFYCYRCFRMGMQLSKENESAKENNEADDFCAFQARVSEAGIKQDRLLLENIYVRVDGGWFPYSYPCSCADDEPVSLYGIKNFAEKTVHAGDCISFSAVACLEGDATDLTFSLRKCADLEVISGLAEMPDTPEQKQQLDVMWHQAERQVCKACTYKDGCRDRKLPCVVAATENGHWNRTLLEKQYPWLIENAISKELNTSDTGGYLEFFVIWYIGSDEPFGYKKDCAVVLGTLPDSPVKVGCRICELDGEEIVSIYQLIGILQRHKPGDKVDILTQFLDEKAIQSTITLVDQRRLVRLMFDCMPFAGRNNDSFVSKKNNIII